MLVLASDFKSDGGCGDALPAGSIPVRFRQTPVSARDKSPCFRYGIRGLPGADGGRRGFFK